MACLISGLLSMSHLSLNALKYVDKGKPVFGCRRLHEREEKITKQDINSELSGDKVTE